MSPKRRIWSINVIVFYLILLPNVVIADEPIHQNDAGQHRDTITIKQQEMLYPTVMVRTRRGSGSGVIIHAARTETDDIFEYRLLTNAHVTNTRFVRYISGVDSITGRGRTETIDTGCYVVTFNNENQDWTQYVAKVIAENIPYDIAILSFESTEILHVAKLATDDMLNNVYIFDSVYAVGCQLGGVPIPTYGIISRILTGHNGEKAWIIYSNTAQITPGSSGGGLFKEYDGHYYLIGIPFRVILTRDQIIPHMAQAISFRTVREIIDQNLVYCK